MKVLHLGQPPHVEQDEGIALKQRIYCKITLRPTTTMAKKMNVLHLGQPP
jgi:hypothetical protein